MIFHTKSGSTYEVDYQNKRARAHKQMNPNYQGDHRLGLGWRTFESANEPAIGQELVIKWGTGRDEHSPDDGLPDESRIRYTTTSRVVRIEP